MGVWGKWVKHAKYIYNIQDFNPERQCLSEMWKQIELHCSQTDVCVPILGSGLTLFEGESLSQQELLNIMIWSYKLSPHKIKAPYKLRIICKKSDGFSLNEIDA